MTPNKESLETYVVLSYPRYKALDQKAKKWEAQTASSQLPETPETMESHPPPSIEPSDNDTSRAEAIGKDITLKYKTTQMKKLLRHIEGVEGAQEILTLPNLEELIRYALTTSRKSLPNEQKFFTFLFSNSLGSYVKNRSKINDYYKLDKPWYEV